MYLVIGANGFLGSYILKNIIELTNEDVIATATDITKTIQNNRIKWEKFNVEDFDNIDYFAAKLGTYKELKVIYLAAYHNPDMVEKNSKIAWNINVTALSCFINQLENIRCFFYPSTDSVYGEGDSVYHFKEEDALNPVNEYGRQKVVAENVVRGYGYNVVRYPFLISPSLSPVKRHFYDYIVETISSGKKIEMFSDSYRSSLDFNTAALLLINLIEKYEKTIPKVLNISGDDDLSKYDIGIKIAQKLNMDQDLIVPIKVEESNGIFNAKRAGTTLMCNDKIKNVLGLKTITLKI